MLAEKQTAPNFTLNDSEGKAHTLSKYLGKKVVLYFYPRDDTPGCTIEACNFRDDKKSFEKKDVVILGVSADTEESHKKFSKKYDLSFTLLSDPNKEVIKKYGAWGEKSMYGKKYEGILRITYLIDEKGKIMKVFPKVSPKDHAEEILSLL